MTCSFNGQFSFKTDIFIDWDTIFFLIIFLTCLIKLFLESLKTHMFKTFHQLTRLPYMYSIHCRASKLTNGPIKLECYIAQSWKGLTCKNTILVSPFLNYEDNKVLWVQSDIFSNEALIYKNTNVPKLNRQANYGS